MGPAGDVQPSVTVPPPLLSPVPRVRVVPARPGARQNRKRRGQLGRAPWGARPAGGEGLGALGARFTGAGSAPRRSLRTVRY